MSPPAGKANHCEANWINPSGGAWMQASNWSTGQVPNSTTTVCIDLAGNYTVFLTRTANVADHGAAESLTLGNGNGADGSPRLRVLGASHTDGTARDVVLMLSADSTVLSDGILELSSEGAGTPGRGILGTHTGVAFTNAGTVQTTPGFGGLPLEFQVNGPVINQAGGVFDFDANTRGVGGAWTNNGTFDLANGVEFELGGTGVGPTFNHTGGGINSNTSGRFLQTNGVFNHTGGGTSGAPIQICASRLNPTGGAQAASFDFVRILGRCDGGALGSDIGANNTVQVNNTSGQANNVQISQPITNAGTLRMTGTGTGSEVQLVGNNMITNTGTFETAGEGNRFIQNPITNAASGTININKSAGSNFNIISHGAFNIADGQRYELTGNGTTMTLAGGTLAANGNGYFIQTTGRFIHTGGTHTGSPVRICSAGIDPAGGNSPISFQVVREVGTCEGGALLSDIPANTSIVVDNTTGFELIFNVAGSFTNAGTLRLTGGTAGVQSVGGPITNNGLLELSGPGHRNFQNTITNGPTGTINALGPNTGNSAPLATSGTVNVATGASFGVPQFNQSGGTTTVNGGLSVSDAPLALSGGTLRGAGTVTGSVNNSAGTVAPGNSPGKLTVTGNYTQGADGTLRAEIAGAGAGTGYDQLAVGGNATIAGTLALEGSTFTPGEADLFDVLTSNSLSGTFGTVTGLAAGGGRTYTVAYQPNKVVVGVVPQFTLEVIKAGTGSGTVTSTPAGIDCGSDCSQAYDSGAEVTLTAIPAAGSTFAGWSGGGCSGTGTCVVTMSEARSVTATFGQVAPADGDSDGVPDASDSCPAQAGPASNQGCPIPVDNTACEEARDKLARAKSKLKKLREADAPAAKIKKAKAKVKKAKAAVAAACG